MGETSNHHHFTQYTTTIISVFVWPQTWLILSESGRRIVNSGLTSVQSIELPNIVSAILTQYHLYKVCCWLQTDTFIIKVLTLREAVNEYQVDNAELANVAHHHVTDHGHERSRQFECPTVQNSTVCVVRTEVRNNRGTNRGTGGVG